MTSRLKLGEHGEVTVTRLAQKKYRARVRYRHIDGKIRLLQATASTRSDASRAVLAKLKDFTIGSNDLTDESSIADATERWWEEFTAKDDKTAGTLHRYRYLINSYLLPAIGDVLLIEATTGNLAAFISSIRKDHGATNAKHLRMILKNVFALVVVHDALLRNPVDGVPAVTVKREKATRALTAEQVQELRKILHGDVLDIYDLMLGTGCRISEALGLRWQDIDLIAGTATIAGAVKESSGKTVWEPAPKSEGSAQTIYLPTYLHPSYAPRTPTVVRVGLPLKRRHRHERQQLSQASAQDAGRYRAGLGHPTHSTLNCSHHCG
ncbi:hypothetical protein E4U03_07090 [Rothia nasimurium]|uniref:Tyr recombinase domain-containing protein n=1 Tax=Rothia nasimurium TaxID=85336 RepID=A0A4Y9F358_9MICC|nr:site-specific integrase [Rothia nasimurium]MBF0808371.1 tyrosine-type recombinase/integrase [Rothia nasimurium]TFU22189.1 hypothetical protein E4U03_07090 [Rothia nasimurium]